MPLNLTDEEKLVEETGLLFDEFSVGKTPGRIIGYLLIAKPPYKSMSEITKYLGMAKSSISVGLRMLTNTKFLEKISIPGERQDYYQINHHFLKRGFAVKTRFINLFREVVKNALEIMDDGYLEHKKSLEEMVAFYEWFEERLPQIFEEWEEKWRKKTSTESKLSNSN